MSWHPRPLPIHLVLCVSALLGSAGCFKSLDELTPFPCPSDGVCSADGGDLICLSGSQCVRSEPCDPVAQDCADPDRPKCTWTASPTKVADGGIASYTYEKQCVPAAATPAREGEACARDESVPDDSSLGRDTCATGLFCSAHFAEDKRCVKLCNTTADCAAGSFCSRPLLYPHSVCVPSCTVFGSCPGERSSCTLVPDVSRTQYFGACDTIANEPQAPGSSCSLEVPDPLNPAVKVESPLDLCMAGHACVMLADGGHCMRMCDPAHPCNEWGACVHLDGMPSDVGICQCGIGGCPEGLGCQVFGPANGARTAMCATASGSVAADEPCTSTDQCPRDTVCWGSNDRYFCRHTCDPEHACQSPQQVCAPIQGMERIGMCSMDCQTGQIPCAHSCCDSNTQVCSAEGLCVVKPTCTSNSDCSTHCCSSSGGSNHCAPATECGCGTDSTWTVACSSGIYCPTGSYCNSDGRTCTCYSGAAFDCSGAPCNGSCSYPNWWCP